MIFHNSKTIRTGLSLGHIKTDIKRTVSDGDVEQLVSVYIENGIAKYAEAGPALYYSWNYRYTLGPAIHADIAFDGKWVVNESNSSLYDFITDESPWVFVVDTDGCLKGYYGSSESYIILASSGVTMVTAIRGWKNVYNDLDDQGLAVFYVRDGLLYYRRYTLSEELIKVWSTEEQVEVNAGSILSIYAFRTNDYRIGVAYEQATGIRCILTKMHWSGMAIKPEKLDVTLKPSVEPTKVNYITGIEDENLALAITSSVLVLEASTVNSFLAIQNIDDGLGDWGLKLTFTTQFKLMGIVPNAFTFLDSLGTSFAVSAVTESDNVYTIDMQDFNNAVGEVTLTMLTGVITNEAGMLFETFTGTFTPTNLDPVPIPPPEVEVIWNE